MASEQRLEWTNKTSDLGVVRKQSQPEGGAVTDMEEGEETRTEKDQAALEAEPEHFSKTSGWKESLRAPPGPRADHVHCLPALTSCPLRFSVSHLKMRRIGPTSQGC